MNDVFLNGNSLQLEETLRTGYLGIPFKRSLQLKNDYSLLVDVVFLFIFFLTFTEYRMWSSIPWIIILLSP